ncbi:hypothetical protein BGX34_010721, partial [Mortierella sp. NVP85]
MLSFSEYAAADLHEHPTFEKQYACFTQYVGRHRSRGSDAAKPDILDLDRCSKDYATMELKGTSRLARKLSKKIIDTGLQEYAKDLLKDAAGGDGSCSTDAVPKAHKKRAREDDDGEKKIPRPRYNHGRRSSITIPDEGTLIDTSEFQVYKYMFDEANIGRLFKAFQVSSAAIVNMFDTRVTLANLPNFLSINYIWDTSVVLAGLPVNVHKQIQDRFAWPISSMPHAHNLRTSLENQLRDGDEILINGDTMELRAIQFLYHN